MLTGTAAGLDFDISATALKTAIEANITQVVGGAAVVVNVSLLSLGSYQIEYTTPGASDIPEGAIDADSLVPFSYGTVEEVRAGAVGQNALHVVILRQDILASQGVWTANTSDQNWTARLNLNTDEMVRFAASQASDDFEVAMHIRVKDGSGNLVTEEQKTIEISAGVINPSTSTPRDKASYYTIEQSDERFAQSAEIEGTRYKNRWPLASLQRSLALAQSDSKDYEGSGFRITARTISAVTNANPCVVTLSYGSVFDDYQDGDYVMFSDVGGMTELNGNAYQITRSGADITLTGVDSTAFGTFTSGGKARRLNDQRVLIMNMGDSFNVEKAFRYVSDSLARANGDPKA
ncbi:MAG: ubiquitin-activating E1 FCCH domain-containing protein [Verrucomicrobiota bacterium]